MPIKVRVGQADAVKILSSAGGGSVESFSSKNVIGGIASVTALDVTGISTFTGNIDISGISTFAGAIDANGNLDVDGHTELDSLNVAGVSTFNDDVFIRNPAGNTIIFRKEGDAFFNGIVTATEADIGNGGLNVDGDVSIADKIIHTGDTNTAIRFPAADTIAAETAGSERLRITSAGQVGIGTTNPEGLLHLYGSSPKLYFTDSDTNVQSHFDHDSGGGNFALNVDVNNVAGSDANFIVRFNQTAPVSAAKFIVKQTGDVGIGTGIPTGINALTNNNATLAVGIITTNSLLSSSIKVGTAITMDAASGIISATTFSGNATTASLATEFTVTANNTTNETVFPLFVDGATGSQGAESDTGLMYNPSTGILSATTFKGSLIGGVTGDITGNISGNAGTATSLANARTIGGVSFDGTANIDLPGVNTSGDQNTTGTAGGLAGTPSITVQDITAEMVSIGGTLSYEDVTNVDSVGIITAQTGVRISTGGLVVTSGVSTFSGIATFTENVFVEGTLTAALIDGGVF